MAGFNGMFRLFVLSQFVRCIASDGASWQHVSVSIEGNNKPPHWDVMCAVKDLFWDDEDCVLQFHPPKSEYVENHPGCLHLWKYTGEGPFEQPHPHWCLVGTKKKYGGAKITLEPTRNLV